MPVEYRNKKDDDGDIEVDGVPEAEVSSVEGTCEEPKSRMLCGPGVSEEIKVNVSQRQWSALSQLLFIAMVGKVWYEECPQEATVSKNNWQLEIELEGKRLKQRDSLYAWLERYAGTVTKTPIFAGG